MKGFNSHPHARSLEYLEDIQAAPLTIPPLAEFEEEGKGRRRNDAYRGRSPPFPGWRDVPGLWERWTPDLAPGSWEGFWAGQWQEQVRPAGSCRAPERGSSGMWDPELWLQQVESWWKSKLGPLIHSFIHQYLLSGYSVPGTLLLNKKTEWINQTIPALMEFTSIKEKQTVHIINNELE